MLWPVRSCYGNDERVTVSVLMSPPARKHVVLDGDTVMAGREPRNGDAIINITNHNGDKAVVLDLDPSATKKTTVTHVSPKSKPASPAEIIRKARETFNRGVTKSVAWRRKQLKSVLRMYEENKDAMIDVLHKDLRRPKLECVTVEIDIMVNDVLNMLHHLDDWIKPTRPPKDFVNILDDVVIHNDPYGVVLIIGPWNYPLQLLLIPMVGAIAAGNAVVIKPTEVAEASANFIAEVIPKYMDKDAVHVVLGGADVTTELLKERFDYIFYTGSTAVGKIIHAAAAKHLTPTTLELGGKSPVYIDDTADMTKSVKRILWGKFINAGQTCIAPDYILCTKKVQAQFVETAKEVIKEWYGENPQASPDFSRIINNRHFSRLQAIIDASKDKIVIGGNYDSKDNYIEPTIFANVLMSDKLMEDELFGPILPIVPVTDDNEAIEFINEKELPLVVYVFSKQKNTHNLFTTQTRSGSVCINDTIMFYAVDTLPFGGVGNSGIGACHGKVSFDTFTHKKSCLVKNFATIGEKLASGRYPPYTERNLKILSTLLRKRFRPSLKFLPYLLCFIVGAAVAYVIVVIHRMASEE